MPSPFGGYRNYVIAFAVKTNEMLTLFGAHLGRWPLPDASWRLLAPPGAFWRFLALPGASWRLLALPGASWRFLAPPGASWHPLPLVEGTRKGTRRGHNFFIHPPPPDRPPLRRPVLVMFDKAL